MPSNVPAPNSFSVSGCRAESGTTALHVEFVAKPQEAPRVQDVLPTAINTAFAEVDGFAGGMVMVANCEARLVTVVTLWRGKDRLQRCQDNLRWVHALLKPYVDRCLRVQTLTALLPESAGAMDDFAPRAVAAVAVADSEQEAIYAA